MLISESSFIYLNVREDIEIILIHPFLNGRNDHDVTHPQQGFCISVLNLDHQMTLNPFYLSLYRKFKINNKVIITYTKNEEN